METTLVLAPAGGAEVECLKDLTTPRAPSPTRASLKFWPGMNVVDVGTRLVIAVTNIFLE